jgi:hypothetical protein
VWDGSVFTVAKFDRFAHNMAEADEILTVLFGLGGSVYDRKDPFGRLFLQTLAMVAEFEADLGRMRTRYGYGKVTNRRYKCSVYDNDRWRWKRVDRPDTPRRPEARPPGVSMFYGSRFPVISLAPAVAA